MQLELLKIDRRPSYDNEYPNKLVGITQFQGAAGKMEVMLSQATVSKIFALIKQDVQHTATQNAALSERACEDAEHECSMLEVF